MLEGELKKMAAERTLQELIESCGVSRQNCEVLTDSSREIKGEGEVYKRERRGNRDDLVL